MRVFGYIVTFQSPIVIEHFKGQRGWRKRMKKAARDGKALQAVKEIKFGTGLSLRESKELWDTKYKSKYYKPAKYD